MPRKSLQDRVRASMEAYDRTGQTAERRAIERRMRALEKQDTDFERGQQAFVEVGFLPKGASRAMRDGFEAAERAEFDPDYWLR
jgi:hypothetical protein